MKLTFIGCGSASTTPDYWQSNLLVEKNGQRFLIDFGCSMQFALQDLGLKPKDIGSYFFTHGHADHVGGVEDIAFGTHFIPGHPKPKLYGIGHMIPDLWAKSACYGLESIQGYINRLEDYFEIHPVQPNETFVWEKIEFRPVQTCHVMNGFKLMDSYGLLLRDFDDSSNTTVLFTGDTQFAPAQLTDFYNLADIIFHDCETAPFPSRVHAHYSDMRQLPDKYKNKMWLYHYQPNPSQTPVEDGFQGFVTKGQSFVFGA